MPVLGPPIDMRRAECCIAGAPESDEGPVDQSYGRLTRFYRAVIGMPALGPTIVMR